LLFTKASLDDWFDWKLDAEKSFGLTNCLALKQSDYIFKRNHCNNEMGLSELALHRLRRTKISTHTAYFPTAEISSTLAHRVSVWTREQRGK